VDDTELKVGGYTFRFVHLAFALPVFSGVAGGAYWGYDVLNRFLDVEAGVEEVLDATARIQALEQTIGDNDVANLSAQLSAISTNMATILDQQKTLLDLRSKVERAELLTNGIDQKLQRLQDDIDSTWDAIDTLEKPL
jgi:uncharacterized protein YoxC